MTTHYTQTLSSPLGTVLIEASEAGVTAIRFKELESRPEKTNAHTQKAATQLTEYFAGKRKNFSLPLDPKGTAFQKSVWQSLLKVGFGETASYSDIANDLGNPKAVRAVGAANGKNPISIVVPCHRVIGKDGSLTGYAGGMTRKAALLALEEQGR
jgi:methylated-DNA-[protein]-cysteine S-methyltransferase